MIASPAASIRASLADRPISREYLADRLGANLDGMLAQYAVVNEEADVRLASHLSNEEAATLPCAGVTAFVAPTGHRRVTAGCRGSAPRPYGVMTPTSAAAGLDRIGGSS